MEREARLRCWVLEIIFERFLDSKWGPEQDHKIIQVPLRSPCYNRVTARSHLIFSLPDAAIKSILGPRFTRKDPDQVHHRRQTVPAGGQPGTVYYHGFSHKYAEMPNLILKLYTFID